MKQILLFILCITRQLAYSQCWIQVSQGDEHSLAIDKEGALYGWGNNSYYQLGIEGVFQPKAVIIDNKLKWKKACAAFNSSFAISSEGFIYSFGLNNNANLAYETLGKPSKNIKKINDEKWTEVSGAYDHVLAIHENGSLWGWGYSDNGQLGINNVKNTSPVLISKDVKWKKISCGPDFSLAIREDGTLWGCGLNDVYQLGLGHKTKVTKFSQIGTSNHWKDVKCGGKHALVLSNDGQLFGMGNASAGELGTQKNFEIKTITKLGFSNNDGIESIEASFKKSVYLKNKNIYSIGSNDEGSNGMGEGNCSLFKESYDNGNYKIYTKSDRGLITKITNYDTSNTETYHANLHYDSKDRLIHYQYGESSDGEFYTYGANGLDSFTIKEAGTQYEFKVQNDNNGKIKQISGPAYYNTGNTNEIFTGKYKYDNKDEIIFEVYNAKSELINRSTFTDPILGTGFFRQYKNIPIYVFTHFLNYIEYGPNHPFENSFYKYFKLESKFDFGGQELPEFQTIYESKSIARIDELNNIYQLDVTDGPGSYYHIKFSYDQCNDFSFNPVQVTNQGDVLAISTSQSNIKYITTKNEIYSVGSSYAGQNGDGTSNIINEPKKIAFNNKIIQMAHGPFSNWFIDDNHQLYAFGVNADGQLGNGEIKLRTNKIYFIEKSKKWKKVFGSNYSAFAIDDKDSLYQIGYDEAGLIKNQLQQNAYPIFTGITDCSYISANSNSQIWIDNQGRMWGSGMNTYNLISQNNGYVEKTLIDNDNKWIKVILNNYNALALKSDGSLWSWGYNGFGQLGHGTLSATWEDLPKQIGNSFDYKDISLVKNNVAMALKKDGTLWMWGTNSGEFGPTITNDLLAPAKIGNNSNWSSLPDGVTYNPRVINENGQIYIWGNNKYGQVGNKGNQFVESSTLINASNTFTDIGGGVTHSIALSKDGELYTWGLNNYGQLGIDNGSSFTLHFTKIISSNCTPTSTDDESNEHIELKVYPNPVYDKLYMNYNGSANTYSIYTSNGIMIYTGTYQHGIAIDTSKLNTGLYLIQIGNKNIKFIKT